MSERSKNSALLGEALLDAIRQAVREEIQAAMIGNGATAKPETAKPYLTIKEAAEMARLAPSTVRLYIRKRLLKTHQVGRRIIIKTSDLEKFLEAQPVETFSQ